MQIRAGFDIRYTCPRPTPMLLVLSVEHERMKDLIGKHELHVSPNVEMHDYRDMFGNIVTRVVAPVGEVAFTADFVVSDSGLPDPASPNAIQHQIQDLPDEVLIYLLGSRYCDTDRLHTTAWSLFGNAPLGWARVQTIVDYVHDRLTFGYEHADSSRTAFDAHGCRLGVCRDFAHLSIALCRCMNIPARYCTGYLGDIGVPPVPVPMDFSAWFEVYLGGAWHTFDARHKKPRIGRILMARGRDATDVAIATTFGECELTQFNVVTDEVV
jgi:transglutaminase-like putative cysteine protease